MTFQTELQIKILTPWTRLNEQLVMPWSVQPELSTIANDAGNLAVAIAHFGEPMQPPDKIKAGEAAQRSVHVSAMRDVADAYKHGELSSANRRNTISTRAMVEWRKGQGFKWLRNGIFIEHATRGTFDFMIEAAKAIAWWANDFGAGRAEPFVPSVIEGADAFRQAIFLFANPELHPNADRARILTFARQPDGSLRGVDPTLIELELRQLGPGESLQFPAAWIPV